ncbi:MAG: helix-hairpin-helix domain-containing protein [bacterium]
MKGNGRTTPSGRPPWLLARTSSSFLLVLLAVGLLQVRADLRREREAAVPAGSVSPDWVRVDVPGRETRFFRVRRGEPLGGLLEEAAPETLALLPPSCLQRPLEGGLQVRLDPGRAGTAGSLALEPLSERERFLMGMRLNVNRAEAEELSLLPGIGPKLAERMRLAREKRGPFSSEADLVAIDGIGRGTVERLRSCICFSPPEGGVFPLADTVSRHIPFEPAVLRSSLLP